MTLSREPQVQLRDIEISFPDLFNLGQDGVSLDYLRRENRFFGPIRGDYFTKATYGGSLAGYALSSVILTAGTEAKDCVLQIHEITVGEEYRLNGIGELLLIETERHAMMQFDSGNMVSELLPRRGVEGFYMRLGYFGPNDGGLYQKTL